jgi:hypothetical protein
MVVLAEVAKAQDQAIPAAEPRIKASEVLAETEATEAVVAVVRPPQVREVMVAMVSPRR